MSVLDQASKPIRKDLMRAAVELHKSGAEPSETPLKEHYSRAELRRAARALGWKGEKTARDHPERAARRVKARVTEVRRAVLVDQGLASAKDRVEHPVRSRLRRR